MSAPAQTPTVARVLAYLVAHPGSTSAPVAAALGLAPRDVARRLADALERGLATRTGAGPSGYAYQVTEAGRARVEGVSAPEAVADADALPVRAAELVRAEPWSTTAELAADLGVDVARADQALRTAARRGQIVGETRLHRGRVVRVWRAVGLSTGAP